MFKHIPEYYYTWGEIIEFLFRIACAGVLGIIVGYDSLRKRKGVGMGTHAMIAISAALIMILSKYSFIDIISHPGSRGADNARMATAVISGVSFLCAGVIFKSDGNIKGLTTAAGMWATAGLGLCVGSGMYFTGAAFTILILALKKVAAFFKSRPKYSVRELHITIKDSKELIDKILNDIKGRGVVIEQSSVRRDSGKLILKLRIHGGDFKYNDETINRVIIDNPDIFEINLFNI